MWAFSTLCDEFSVASRLYLKLDLAPSRETLLHFYEQVRRSFPGMIRFRRRHDGTTLLEELGDESGQRRFLRISGDSLLFGLWSPPDREAVCEFAQMVLTHAPYHLSLSDLDYDSLEVLFAFDLEYCGNHDELVAEALLGERPLHTALLGGARRVIDWQPSIGLALSDDCTTQAYLQIRGRTSMYELRSGEYETQPLSVYLSIRRYFREGAPADLTSVHEQLLTLGEELAVGRVVPQIVRPLQEAIASRR